MTNDPTTTTTTRPAPPARSHRLVAAALALATAGLLVGCSSGGSDDGTADGTTSTTVAGATTTVTPASDLPDVPDDGGSTGAGPTDGGGNTGGDPDGSDQAPSGAEPVITSFTTPENIDCHNGDFQEFSASWTTTGATKTMISIDGPGGYRTYGPNDSDSLPFSCSTPHTFLLTAYGPGDRTATRSITLQPRNVQPSEPTDQPDDVEPTDAEVDVQE